MLLATKQYVWGGLAAASLLAFMLVGCTVKQAPPPKGPPPPPGPSGQGAGPTGDCGQQQDSCVARCKAAVPDEASRQPCYNKCMQRGRACGG